MNKFFSELRSPNIPLKNENNTKTAIIPADNISGQALITVIAIMTFLSCLALVSVDLVHHTANDWNHKISREATIQIHHVENVDIEKNLRDAVKLVKTFRDVQAAEIVDQKATEKLLAPWLGTSLKLDTLPLPRLIIVTLKKDNVTDLNAISQAIQKKIPGGQFDDHRFWINHFTTISNKIVFVGFAVLILFLGSLVLTITFATRNALAENAHIINVLYFLGTEAHFIARQFDWHFFKTALRGAFYGGVTSILLFSLFSLWINYDSDNIRTRQLMVLFGHFSINFETYVKILFLIFFVSFLTVCTSRKTILVQLKKIDQHEQGLF